MSCTEFAKCLYDYQTLITGICALFAAFLSVRFLRLQIKQEADHEAHRRLRRRVAARAVLPVTLTRVSTYITAHMELLREGHYRLLAGSRPDEVFAAAILPKLDDEVFAIIERTIEADDTPGVEEALASMASRIQILTARVAGLIKPPPTRFIGIRHVEDYIIDCALAQGWCDLLFKYARKDIDQVRRSDYEGVVRNALAMYRLSDARTSKILRDLERHLPPRPRFVRWWSWLTHKMGRRFLGWRRR